MTRAAPGTPAARIGTARMRARARRECPSRARVSVVSVVCARARRGDVIRSSGVGRDDDEVDVHVDDARGRSDEDGDARIHSWATRGRRRRVGGTRGDARASGGACGVDARGEARRGEARRGEWVGGRFDSIPRARGRLGANARAAARRNIVREWDDDPSATRASGVYIYIERERVKRRARD